ncbi:CHAD domain-containing protein, partial [Cribrihabitans sp. XS_ASV171]
MLFSAGGEVLVQDAARAGAFVADMSPGPVRDALSDISPLRALLEIASGTATTQQAALLDDEEKTQARAVIRVLSAEGAEVTLISVEHMRGYDKAYDALLAMLAAQGARAEKETIAERLAPEREAYVSKPAVPLGGDQSAHDVAVAIIRAYLSVARRN